MKNVLIKLFAGISLIALSTLPVYADDYLASLEQAAQEMELTSSPTKGANAFKNIVNKRHFEDSMGYHYPPLFEKYEQLSKSDQQIVYSMSRDNKATSKQIRRLVIKLGGSDELLLTGY